MGGKRPDQYQIDENEGRTTDHKFMPHHAEDAKHSQELYGRVMKGTARREQPIPSSAPEPEAEAERQRLEAEGRLKPTPEPEPGEGGEDQDQG